MPASDPTCPDCVDVPVEQAASPFWGRLFDTSDYPPRWHCGNWDATTGWMHITADVATWLAYTAIPLLLLVVLRRRKRDIPTPGLVVLFAAFILSCGAVHLLEAIIFWWPAYRLSAVMKVGTALVSVTTVVVLARVLPLALELRGPRQLEEEVEVRTRELAKSEAERAEAQRRAERADEAKSRFLAAMSHELRTPVAAILGQVELTLEEDEIDPERLREQLELIRRSAAHQHQLIDDVLELSRIEAGKLELSLEPAAPAELAETCLELVRPRAERAGTELRLVLEGDLSAETSHETDPLRVRQILLNLLSNAIKFTPEGVVTLTVRMAQEGAALRVEYVVGDTGIGMSPQQLERIFEAYVQAESHTARDFGGTGLGLAISRRLARLLGGDLRAESEPERGSSFTVEVVGRSVEHAPDAEAVVKPPVDLTGVRVLLAEDQPDLALVVTRQLELVGCEVVRAKDGLEALEESGEGRFDVVLLDLQMPNMGGLEAVREMRRRGWSGPIVALTANALHQDREECLASGFDGFATKPLGAADLRELVASYRGGARPAA